MSVYHWLGQHCTEQFSFAPDEDGLSAFNEYLAQTKDIPVRLLVDVIEEDFDTETVPHVGKKDRDSIVRRIIQRNYRKSENYFYYGVKGREKEGRRDDRIQYSVLTNPDLLAPWLKLIKQNNTPLSGIWSLPRISEKLFRHIDSDEKNVLLVSQQVPSNLRQSYFVNGVFESSRSAVINLDESPLGDYIAEETDQTIRFLANQRHIGFDEKISIHMICREEDIKGIREKCVDTPIREFHFHKIQDIEAAIGCVGLDGGYCSGIYSYLCKSIVLPKGNYGPADLFAGFRSYLMARTLRVSGILSLAITLLMAMYIVLDVQDMDDATRKNMEMTEVINRQYKEDFVQVKTQLDKAESIKSVVMFYDRVVEEKAVSPQSFMVSLGHLLGRDTQSNINIISMTWEQTQASLKEISNRKFVNQVSYGVDKPVKHYATVTAVMSNKDEGVRKEADITSALVDKLRHSKQVEEVEIMKIPVDLSETASFQSAEGLNKKTIKKEDIEFRVILQGADI